MKILKLPKFNSEHGQTLVMVIILLLVSSIVVVPLLQFMGTGIKASNTHENKMNELYAADAGIEDAKWQIKSGNIETDNTTFPSYSAYNFTTTWPYTLSQPVNGITPVSVNITNVWIPKDITPSSESEARNIIQDQKLVVTGTTQQTGINVSGTYISRYTIKITYTPASGENLAINNIGIWLPPGYEYFTDNNTYKSNLESTSLAAQYRSTPAPYTPWAGNLAVIWTYSTPPLFNDFPDPPVSGAISKVMEVEFFFKPTNQTNYNSKPEAVAWVKTSGVSDIPYAWDADVRVFKLTSTAVNTTVESYMAKSELRKLEAAVAGDYHATGNTLMIPSGTLPIFNPTYYRDYLFNESSATVRTASSPSDVKGIPASATVEYAYLYWSGWQETGANGTPIFSDDCSNFTQDHSTVPVDANWARSGPPGGNTGLLSPTSNAADTGGDGNGFEVNPINAYANNSDDSSRAENNNNGDGVNGDRHRFWGYDTSTIPSTSSIAGIEVRLDWWMESTSGTNSVSVDLSWDGGTNWTSPKTDNEGFGFINNSSNNRIVGGSSDDWGHLWLPSELSSSNFRVRIKCNSSSDSRDFRLDWIAVRVTYTGSMWTVESGEFRGQGDPDINTEQKTLTMVDSLDLSSYISGRVQVSWDQRELGSLNSADTLYYAFSGNGGASWSTNCAAFSDDNPPATHAPVTIPDVYLKSGFKMRFYFNFTDATKYVYLDDITITVLEDPVVAKKVNRVLFTAEDPVTHASNTTQITADHWATVSNLGIEPAWSYSCFKDVTALVNEMILYDTIETNGTAKYTVGHVIDDTGSTPFNLRSSTSPYSVVDTTDYPLSIPAKDASGGGKYQYTYCGWSLVIIYSSPETTGHQLYLFDQRNGYFNFMNLSTVLTLNVTGFIAPPDTTGSHMTYFIGEGDSHYTGEYMKVNTDNLPCAGDPYEIPVINPQNNVFNSNSNSLDDPYISGVDIDTFDMSDSISAGSTTATVEMNPKEMLDLIFIILSFRSEATTSGAFSYIIR
jgi:hypothetical protein